MEGEKLDVVDLGKTGVWGGVEPFLRTAPWGKKAEGNHVAG